MKSVRVLEPKFFEEGLQSLNLYSKEYMHPWGELSMTYSILNTSEHPLKHLLRLSPSLNPRGNTQKLVTQHSGMNCRSTFSSSVIGKYWNSLPAELIQAASSEFFNRKLDICLRTSDRISLWFTNCFRLPHPSLNIPMLLPEGDGDPLILYTETRLAKSSNPSWIIWAVLL